MLYRFEDRDPAMLYYYEATPEDLAADPAVQVLVADAVRREREAVVAWLKKRPGSTDGYAIDHGAHHPTETDR